MRDPEPVGDRGQREVVEPDGQCGLGDGGPGDARGTAARAAERAGQALAAGRLDLVGGEPGELARVAMVDAIGLLGLVGAGLAVLGAVLSGWLIRQRGLRHAGLTPTPDATDRSDVQDRPDATDAPDTAAGPAGRVAGGLVQNGGTRSRRPPEEIV
ncbi:hypothetical protein [Nonomuraea rubra]|uniref:hypothetical protein n=1 Tax=Nonomuraea rubra TaxID=46180 RepID=UPI0033CE7F20